MAISSSYPYNLQNGVTADATQVMANFLQIQNDVNANAAHSGVNSDITQLTGLTTALSIAQGGTGAQTSAAALAALGGAPLLSPAFSGTPTAPTASPGTNTTQLATTAFVVASYLTIANAAAVYAPLASPALTGTPTVPTAAPGTNTTQIATTAFTTAAIAAAGVTRFTSGEISVSSNASTAHGLGQVPFGYSVSLRCKTAEGGYSVGDEIMLPTHSYSGGAGGTPSGSTVWADTTSVGVVDNILSINNKSTALQFIINAANWRFIFKAWK